MSEPVPRRAVLKRGAALAAVAALAPLLAACTDTSGPATPNGTPTEGPEGSESDPPHTWFAPA